MNRELASIAMQFLTRCPLKGTEVLTFLEVMNELEKMAEPREDDTHNQIRTPQGATEARR